MHHEKQVVISIASAVLLILAGTLGYMLLEGWDPVDALYMTVITLATVGYREIHPMSRMGQLYTMFLIMVGVGFFLYVAGTVIQFMVEGRIRILLGRRKLDRKIARLKNHYIVCGFGRIGSVICQRLDNEGASLVVIERNDQRIEQLEQQEKLYINGDASDETNLVQAGIGRAKALIAALGTDTDNVFLVLTARQLAPKLKIIARASNEKAKSKLLAAGASMVESPYEMGAATMAQRVIRPTVTSFFDLAFAQSNADIQMEEIPVTVESRLNGLILQESGIRQEFNLIIIAIKQADGQMLFNPSFEARISAGDTVIAVGQRANLKRLEAVLNPKAHHDPSGLD